MSRCCIGGAALLVVLSSAPQARAQVNIETLRGKARAGLHGGVDAAFTGRTGNTTGMDGGGSAKSFFVSDPNRAFAYGSLDYTRLNGILSVSRRWGHLRYERLLSAMWSGEVFGQIQTDAIRRLSLRELVGAGPRLRFIDDHGLSAAVGIAAMLEHERIRVPAGASDDPETIVQRLSCYVSALWAADDRVTLNAVAYFQPRVERLHDFRVLVDAGAIFAINKRLAAKLVLGIRHDNEPPTSVLRTDVELKNALSVSF